MTIQKMGSYPIVCASEITCPHCGYKRLEDMPVDACLFFYQCKNCGNVIRPKTGDCCVFCSYGSVRCPSKQAEINVSL